MSGIETIYLHVGAPRTGTTALQIVTLEKQELLNRAGLFRPIAEYETHILTNVEEAFFSGNLDPMADALLSGEMPGKVSDDIERHLAKLIPEPSSITAPNILLSSEKLSNATAEQLQMLRLSLQAYFPNHSPRVVLVFCVRDLFDHAISWWALSMRRAICRTDRLTHLLHHYENYQYQLLKNAVAVFDRDDILCVHYSKQVNLLQAIAEHANIQLPKEVLFLLKQRRPNRSLSVAALTYMQSLVDILPEGSWTPSRDSTVVSSSLFNELGNALSQGKKEDSDIYRLDADSHERVSGVFRQKFEDEIVWMNDSVDIRGGPLHLIADFAAAPEQLNTGEGAMPSSVTGNGSVCDLGKILLKEALQKKMRVSWFDDQTVMQIDQVVQIRNSGIFDDLYYFEQLQRLTPPIERLERAMTVVHFLTYGVELGVNPSPYFDVPWYLNANPDVAQSYPSLHPALHYVLHGAREGRSPHPKIDVETATALRLTGNLVGVLNLYSQLLRSGFDAGRVPIQILNLINRFESTSNKGSVSEVVAMEPAPTKPRRTGRVRPLQSGTKSLRS